MDEQGAVPVSKHQFWIVDTGMAPAPPFDYTNGLAHAQHGAVIIFTGISTGPVWVTTAGLDTPPETADLDNWDDVVELSAWAPVGNLVVSGAFNDAPAMPALTVAGPGTYRIRIRARGRDTAVDLAVSEPSESYHLTAWPAEPSPDAILKATSDYGANLRSRRHDTPHRTIEPTRTDARTSAKAKLQAMNEQLRQP